MYVVFGVTGNTGKVVADTLLAQKKPVRVVVRDAAKGEPWKARGAEVAVATVTDAKAIENALRGAAGAYILLPPNYASNTVLEDKKKEVAAFAAAIPASGVKHVVLLSSIGAHQPDGTGPIRSVHRGLNEVIVYSLPELKVMRRIPFPSIRRFFPEHFGRFDDPRLGFHHSTLTTATLAAS